MPVFSGLWKAVALIRTEKACGRRCKNMPPKDNPLVKGQALAATSGHSHDFRQIPNSAQKTSKS